MMKIDLLQGTLDMLILKALTRSPMQYQERLPKDPLRQTGRDESTELFTLDGCRV